MKYTRSLSALWEADLAYQHSVVEMDDAAIGHLRINRSDSRCLSLLIQRGEMSAGELAGGTGLSRAAFTALLDRLEQRGLVTRTLDQDDRRRVRVAPTELTREAAATLYGSLPRPGSWLSGRSEDEVAVITEYLRYRTRRNQDNAARIRSLPHREEKGARDTANRSHE